MGAVSSSQQRSGRLSTSSENGRNGYLNKPQLREHKRYGVVVVKYQSSTGATRRNPENIVSQVVTPRGVILYGTLYNPTSIQRAINSSGFPMLVPTDMAIPDSRAHRLLVSYCQGWHLVPFPEVFSRHSGTCYVVGDRNNTGIPFQIKIGDCFRLGSVGLVVSELKLPDQEEQKLDAKSLQFLKDEALAFDMHEEWAQLASEELAEEGGDNASRVSSSGERLDNMGKSTKTMMELDNLSQKSQENDEEDDAAGTGRERKRTVSGEHRLGSGGVIGSAQEKFFCYMCYEMHNTEEDPLIAPCDCKGDTRFLHVQCLQKWYHSSALGTHAQVIRTTGNGAPACKICGSAYKTNFRRQDGRKASILENDHNGPYISLVVVTHHDTNPGLFNTKFRLKFGRQLLPNSMNNQSIPDEALNTIMIGRSSSCAMVLDYRTVSTTHAKITFSNGKFYLTDERSSNGTLVYLQDPLPLPYGQTVKVRMGRTTLSLQAKRSWSAAVRSYFFGNGAQVSQGHASAVSSSVERDSESPHFHQNSNHGLSSMSFDNERPSMSPQHFHQLQLHQQHLQQLRQNHQGNNNLSTSDSVDYSMLSSAVVSSEPSPCDIQALLEAVIASVQDPNKPPVSSNHMNNTGGSMNISNSNLLNSRNYNSAEQLSNGAYFFHSVSLPRSNSHPNLIASAAAAVANSNNNGRNHHHHHQQHSQHNANRSNGDEDGLMYDPYDLDDAMSDEDLRYASNNNANNNNNNSSSNNNQPMNSSQQSDNGSGFNSYSPNRARLPVTTNNHQRTMLPSQQHSERTLEMQDSHYFNASFLADDLSTMDNTVVVPLRSGQPSFVLRSPPSDISSSTNSNNNNNSSIGIAGNEYCMNSARQTTVLVPSNTSALSAPVSTTCGPTNSGTNHRQSRGSSANNLAASGGMMVSCARGVDDGSGIVIPQHYSDEHSPYPQKQLQTYSQDQQQPHDGTSPHGMCIDERQHQPMRVDDDDDTDTVREGQMTVSASVHSLAVFPTSMVRAELPSHEPATSTFQSLSMLSANPTINDAASEDIITSENGNNNNNNNSNSNNNNALLTETESLLGSLPAANRYAIPARYYHSNGGSNRSSNRNSPVPQSSSTPVTLSTALDL